METLCPMSWLSSWCLAADQARAGLHVGMESRVEVCIVSKTLIENLLAQNPEQFLAHFAQEEQDYCLAHTKKAVHLAARFAAKKAVCAILGADMCMQWKMIVVNRAASGCPSLHLVERAAEYAQALAITRWHLSLTHTEAYAAALVVAEKSTTQHSSKGNTHE